MDTSSAPAAVDDPPIGAVVRRKRGRPRDPSADSRIMEAAAGLILTNGFENMTVDEVAARAGVGKATVYRRWARKEDLAVAAIGQLYSAEMPNYDTGSIRGDLRAMIGSALAFVNSEEGAGYLRMTIKESMRDPRVAALHRSANERAEEGAKVAFRRAMERGEVRADLNLDAIVQVFAGLCATRTVTGSPMPAEHELDSLVDLLLVGAQA